MFCVLGYFLFDRELHIGEYMTTYTSIYRMVVNIDVNFGGKLWDEAHNLP